MLGGEFFEELGWFSIAAQIIGNQMTATFERPVNQRRTKDVGHGRKTTVARDRQPGALGLPIAATINVRSIRPPVSSGRWPAVHFIPIGRNEQGMLWVRTPGDTDQTHAGIIAEPAPAHTQRGRIVERQLALCHPARFGDEHVEDCSAF